MTFGARLKSWVDGAVRIVSPRRAAKRAQWDALQAHYRLMASDPHYAAMTNALVRGYRSARGGTATKFGGSNGSADSELSHDLPTLRARSREIDRDNPIGSGLHESFVTNVIGTGLRPQALNEGERGKRINKAMEAIWKERSDTLFPGSDVEQGEAQQVILRSGLGDGDVLVKEAKMNSRPDEPVWFEIVEADRLSTPLDRKPADPQGEIRDGVEKNRYGHVLAYHVLRGHPGELGTGKVTDQFTHERVPASSAVLLRLVRRPGQTRGEPQFHAIMQDLLDLDLLLQASLKRVQLAAMVALVIKSQVPLETLLDGMGAQSRPPATEKFNQIDHDFEQGMVFGLQPNEDITTVLPNFPTPELGPFIIMLARRVGAALGVSWQIVLKDFSESTYSSARTDLLEARRPYIILRNWFGRKCMTWLWTAVMRDARLRGELALRGVSDEEIAAVKWIGDSWPWVDPKNEVLAAQVELSFGGKTLEQYWLSRGDDPDEMREALRAQKQFLEEIGLELTGPGQLAALMDDGGTAPARKIA